MGGLFGGKKPKPAKPKVVKVPAAQDDAEKQRQRDDEESRRRRANLASNVLFGNEAEATDPGAVSIKKKQLLGE